MKIWHVSMTLACVCLLGAKQYTIPMATGAHGSAPASSGAGTSLITSSLSGLPTNGSGFLGYLGFGMTFKQAIVPKQLCAYRVAGDSSSARTVVLMDESSQTVLAQATIDMTRGAVGAEVCVNVNAGAVNTYDTYDLIQQETRGDLWADQANNSVTLTSAATWKYAAYCANTAPPCYPNTGGSNGVAYGIPDLKY